MDSIDASIIGLRSTLQMLQQYRQSGVLQAEIPRFPGIRGTCIAYIQIVEGMLYSCYVQNRKGQQQAVEIQTLLHLNEEKGPFEWRLFPQNQPTQNIVSYSPSPSQQNSSRAVQPISHAVPHVVAPLNLDWLTSWPPQQKRALRMVYSTINNQRTVAEIERLVPLPHHVVQEALVVLIAMKIIVVVT